MNVLIESVDTAQAVCEVKETGGSLGSAEAWSGATSDGDKKRLAGSIVKLKAGADKFAYLPASSGASLFRTGSIKLSTTGAETGSYHSKDEAASMIDSVWLGAAGAGVEHDVGPVKVRLEPVVGAEFAELRSVSSAGIAPAKPIGEAAQALWRECGQRTQTRKSSSSQHE